MARKISILNHVGFSIAAMGAVGVADAAVPNFLTEQGRLFNSAGMPVTAATSFRFAIYDVGSGGTILWSETESITPDEGYFSAVLGDGATAFPADLFDGRQLFLGIKIGADPELTPRQPIDSVPYAILAGNVNGDITPTSVSVGGMPVINSDGEWVGDPTGLMGPQGPQGAVGPQGAKGADGADGADGPQGVKGAQGAAGPQGTPGAAGADGPQGVKGAQGAAGPQGTPGTNGADGPQGVKGAQGAAGPQGAPGVIASFHHESGSITVTPGATTGEGVLPLNFFGPAFGAATSVAVTATDRIMVFGNAQGWASAASAEGWPGLYACYRTSGATNNTLGSNAFARFDGSATVQKPRHAMGVSEMFTGLTGTYQFGICGEVNAGGPVVFSYIQSNVLVLR